MWALAAGAGCGGGNASDPTAAVESLVPRARTAHFEVHAGLAPEATVAESLFENDEFVDPRSISYLVQGRFPTLSELDADPSASRQVYEVGYLIGEFVVARAGRSGLLRLIRANGDVTVLGFASPAAFESEWQSFVRARYFVSAGLTLGEAVQ